jgi:hypothetical protein
VAGSNHRKDITSEKVPCAAIGNSARHVGEKDERKGQEQA